MCPAIMILSRRKEPTPPMGIPCLLEVIKSSVCGRLFTEADVQAFSGNQREDQCVAFLQGGQRVEFIDARLVSPFFLCNLFQPGLQ